MTAMFDLEQSILKCWNITDDMDEILDDVESGHTDMAEMTATLRAYNKVYQRRFQRCFDNFENYVAEMRDLRLRITELEQSQKPSSDLGKRAKSKSKKEVDQ